MADRIKVLYLTYDGLTDPLGESQILPYLKGLAEDYEIFIVSFEKPARLKIKYDEVKATCEKANIRWMPLTYHKNPPVFSVLYDLYMLRRKIRQLAAEHDFKILHCRSYVTSLVSGWMKAKYNTKFIFDMRGFWADERVEGGIWRRSNLLFNLIYKFFKKKEQQFIDRADYVIVLTEAARSIVSTWNNKARIKVIPCCVDTRLFDPSHIDETKRQKIRNELGIGHDDYVLVYLGSLGTWYLLDKMEAFFNQMKIPGKTVKFLILTPDIAIAPKGEQIIARTANRSDVPAYLSISDASVCFIKPTFSKKGSSATKLGEILAMNIPVFVNSGWGDIDTIYRELQHLLVNLDLPFASIENISGRRMDYRELALEYFDLNKGIAAYKSVYNELARV